MFIWSRQSDCTEPKKDWVHQKTILMFCLVLNPVLSEQFLPEIHAESWNGGRAQLSVSPVSPQPSPELIWVFVGCMCAWVRSIYIGQSRCLLWSLSDQSCSWQWGEVSLWFSSAVTLSIGSAGCIFSMLLAEISASLFCCSLGPASTVGSSFCATIERFKLGLPELPPSAFSFVGTLCACVRAAVSVLSCVFVWCVQADQANTEHPHQACRVSCNSGPAIRPQKQNSHPPQISLCRASESGKFHVHDQHFTIIPNTLWQPQTRTDLSALSPGIKQ